MRCHCIDCQMRRARRIVRGIVAAIFVGLFATVIAVALLAFTSCTIPRPQKGGGSTATLGGANAPTVVSTNAPENPSTPSTTSVEKETVTEYELPPTIPATAGSQGDSAREQPETSPRRAAAQSESRVAAATVQGASPAPKVSEPGAAAPVKLLRQSVREKSTTQTGAAQKDTARELGTRLANMRGVMWVGVLLLIVGPIVGWKLGWFTNGCIAGGVGLGLVILAQVVPGNEAWFGLFGLLLIPLVAYAWIHGHHAPPESHPPTP